VATSITKLGGGTMVLAPHCSFKNNAQVNAGGLVVSNIMRNMVDGVVVGNVTLNDGFLAGRGSVGAILAKKGEVAPGRPLIEGDFRYQLSVNQTAVASLPVNPLPEGVNIRAGTLECISANFVDKDTAFAVGIYNRNGDCDRLRILDAPGGFVSLGSGDTSSSLRPLWRSTETANRAQWYVIMDNGLGDLPNGNFVGMPHLPPELYPWICYNYIPGNLTTDEIQPDPLDAPFLNKLTNGSSVAIRVNGVVNFTENRTINENPYQDIADLTAKPTASFTVPEVKVADGSAIILPMSLSASGAGKVSYKTIDGSAVAFTDFTPGDGQVDAPGTGPEVAIIYNQTIRDPRSFTVTLRAPTEGLALGRPSTATVKILDINADEDQKKSGCGLSSGFAVFFLLIAGLGRLVVLRRRRD
jgi:hypothetical protein